MKNIFLWILFAIGGLLSAQQIKGYVHFPDNVDNPLTSLEKRKIKEVFKDNTAFVYDNATMLKNIKDLMRNRVKVYYLSQQKANGSKEYREAKLITSVPLYSSYNKNLRYDVSYNKSNFNILKYQLNFYPNKKEIYKLGNHYIVVLPQKRTKK